MRRRSVKIILATTAVAGLLGVGIASAATDTRTCPYGNTPKAAQVAKGQGNGDQTGLRKRDGTGPYHAQNAGQRQRRGGHGQQLRLRDGTGPRHR